VGQSFREREESLYRKLEKSGEDEKREGRAVWGGSIPGERSWAFEWGFYRGGGEKRPEKDGGERGKFIRKRTLLKFEKRRGLREGEGAFKSFRSCFEGKLPELCLICLYY